MGLRIRIRNDQTLDEMNFTMQLILGWMQDDPILNSPNVDAFGYVSIYLTLFDKNGKEKVVKIEHENEYFMLDAPPSNGKGKTKREPSRRRKRTYTN